MGSVIIDVIEAKQKRYAEMAEKKAVQNAEALIDAIAEKLRSRRDLGSYNTLRLCLFRSQNSNLS
jgi:hypothetical protein